MPSPNLSALLATLCPGRARVPRHTQPALRPAPPSGSQPVKSRIYGFSSRLSSRESFLYHLLHNPVLWFWLWRGYKGLNPWPVPMVRSIFYLAVLLGALHQYRIQQTDPVPDFIGSGMQSGVYGFYIIFLMEFYNIQVPVLLVVFCVFPYTGVLELL